MFEKYNYKVLWEANRLMKEHKDYDTGRIVAEEVLRSDGFH